MFIFVFAVYRIILFLILISSVFYFKRAELGRYALYINFLRVRVSPLSIIIDYEDTYEYFPGLESTSLMKSTVGIMREFT